MRPFTGARRATTAYVGLVLALLVTASCGGGGGSSSGTPTTTSASAPVVSNFQIRPLTPEKANTEVRYQITATVIDPNNDLMGGRVELSDGTRTLTLAIDATVLQGNTIGVILITNRVPAGRYTGSFAVVDAAGNRSDEITFAVNIEALTPSSGGGFIDRLAPAR